MDRTVRVAKRALDLVCSGIGLALTLPLFPFIAVAVYLDSPGPVFFRQKRAGVLLDIEYPPGGGVARPRFREFQMMKFRSMRPDAEKGTGAVLATANDPRITRVGKFLHRARPLLGVGAHR